MHPRATVIVPVFNGAETLAAQLDALRHQSMSNFEVLVVDNGSTDTSKQIANRFALLDDRFIVLDAAEFAGPAWARNVGIAYARSERILFCDCDDLVAPRWVEAHLGTLDQFAVTTGPILGVTDCDLAVSTPEQLFASPNFTSEPLRVGRTVSFASTSNAGFRSTVLLEIGGFDVTLLRGEDVAASILAGTKGFGIGFARDAHVLRRRRSSGMGGFRQGFGNGVSLAQLRRRGLLNRADAFSALTLSSLAKVIACVPLLLSRTHRPWVARHLGAVAGVLLEVAFPGRPNDWQSKRVRSRAGVGDNATGPRT